MGVFMPHRTPKVSGLFPPPDRTDCLKGISRALLRIRSEGYSLESLGTMLGCTADTISNASNEKTMLSFESFALLGFYFPDHFALIAGVWNCHCSAPLTVADWLERIEADTAAIRREVV